MDGALGGVHGPLDAKELAVEELGHEKVRGEGLSASRPAEPGIDQYWGAGATPSFVVAFGIEIARGRLGGAVAGCDC